MSEFDGFDEVLSPEEGVLKRVQAGVWPGKTRDEAMTYFQPRPRDAELVRRVTRLVDVAEWKRRQAPIGVRVTPKAFGKDRRLPITNRYRDEG